MHPACDCSSDVLPVIPNHSRDGYATVIPTRSQPGRLCYSQGHKRNISTTDAKPDSTGWLRDLDLLIRAAAHFIRGSVRSGSWMGGALPFFEYAQFCNRTAATEWSGPDGAQPSLAVKLSGDLNRSASSGSWRDEP